MDKISGTATSIDFCVVSFWHGIICGGAYLENSTVYILRKQSRMVTVGVYTS